MDLEIEKNISYLIEMFSRKICASEMHEKFVRESSEMKMSSGAKSLSYYGLFPPHKNIELLTYSKKLGKLTDKPDRIDFRYYFDKQGRVSLIERYDPNSASGSLFLNDYIFIEYKDCFADIIFCTHGTDKIGQVARCVFDEQGELESFIEGYYDIKNGMYGFTKMYYNYTDSAISVKRIHCYSLGYGKQVRYGVNEYVCKDGKVKGVSHSNGVLN